MRIGATGSAWSSHAAGMSSLWHDPDFIPEKRFETPVVHKSYDGLPMPTEQHKLPDGVADPFARLDEVYDAAAAQMERGIKGAAFLHGKPPPAHDVTHLARADDVTRLAERPAQVHVDVSQREQRLQRNQHERVTQAGATPLAPSSSTKTAAQGEADRIARAGGASDALGAAATFVPLAVSQAVTSTVQGPVAALASSAVQTAGAVATAAEVAAAGIDAGLTDEPVARAPRRGLRG